MALSPGGRRAGARSRLRRTRRRRSRALNASTGERTADVIVIGAGLSGLVAARDLRGRGCSVRVLEARDRVGGRILNHGVGDGAVIELGGAYVGPTQVHVLALARELGIATFPASVPGDQVLVRGRRVKRFRGDVPPDVAALPGLAITMALVNRLSRQVPVDAPWSAPRAREWDSVTLETWLERMTPGLGRGALEWFNVFLSSAFGGEARDTSLLFMLWYVAMFGDASHPGTIERGIATEGGAQESRLVGGSQALALRLAESLGDAITLGEPVRAIEQSPAAARVGVRTASGVWTASRAIVAVPPQLAAAIEWAPTLPPAHDALLRRMPFGTLAKCDAVYDTPFWRERGLNGMAVLRDGTPIRSMFDATPPSGRPGVLMGFLGGEDWRRWAGVAPDARRDAVLRCFARAFGPRALSPRDYVETDWVSEPFSRGGPTTVMGPGTLVGFGSSRGVAHGRVHWAGTETARYWSGFMDGAVSAGHRAAREVQALL